MLRRALPFVLAGFVIAPVLAQTTVRSPASPQGAAGAQAQASYFPERLDWQQKTPEEVGMNGALLNEAVQLAIAADTPGTHDMALFLHNSFGKEPFSTLVGPVKDRGPASGIITRHGYIVAKWGDPNRADIVNSVTKTFLTTVVGLAWQKGLIKDVNDYAKDYMPPHVDLFESEFWTRRDSIAGRCRRRKRRCLVETDFQQLWSSYSCLHPRRVDCLLSRAVDWSHRLCLWSVFHCPLSIVPL